MTHASLFSGIGGFDLAAKWMGWENKFHCEINPFGQKILKHYWPNATSYDDIKKSDFSIHRGTINVLSGGFPCQDASYAYQNNGGGSRDYKDQGPDCFTKCAEQSKKLNQTSLLPRTWQVFLKLTEGKTSVEYSLNYPQWGTMQNGEYVMRQKSVPRTEGQGSTWLLTPTASEYKEIKAFFPYYQKRLHRSAGRLREQMWRLTQITNGYVNPRFILWVMGFPKNWTLLQTQSEPEETR